MRFTATEQQIKQMVALAVNASVPMGLGHFGFKAQKYKAEDFNARPSDGCFVLDYFQGRMVKLRILRIDDNIYDVPDFGPLIEYQSWCDEYPT